MITKPDIVTTIFYVDDDPDDLEMFQLVINEIGENVKLFHSGEEFMNALGGDPPLPSIIFFDLNMPVKTGYEILYDIKTSGAYKGMPRIVYSTSSSATSIKKCRELGACLYIIKPSSMAALKKAIEHVLSIDWKTFTPNDDNFVYIP